MSDVTHILSQIESGDLSASEQLLPLVYDELRKLAIARLAQEQPGQTLQATALVHEAYMRLIGSSDAQLSWDHRGHFFAAAAEAMRRILVDSARRKASQKRGGGRKAVHLDEAANIAVADDEENDDILALHEALAEFEQIEPIKAKLVKLRYFAGLTLDEASENLGISVATAKRYWVFARAWLYGKITGE